MNALFMPSLNHEGIISSKQCIRQQGAEFKLKGKGSYMLLEGQLIPLKDDEELHYVNSVDVRLHTTNNTMDQWHSILGHPDPKAVARTEGVVTGMHITGNKKPSQCIVCIRGKKVVRLSRTPDERATKPFEWIHTDISGPRNVESTTGDKNYLITFVCDYSNFITVYPVKSRSQIVEVLEDFLVFANQLGTVCKIRSDNAAEYLSKQFREVCTKNSILQQTSAPYCPSQNGTAERSFRTLGNKERCLLEESKLPEGFWPQAASYAAYLHNRTYCHRIRCTPFELAYGKRPNLAKLMRFGQNVEAYIHKGLRSNKVSPRTKPGRFVGICKLSSANLVYFQSENKVRPCAHTIAINDSVGTHGSSVRGHNASQDA